MEWLNSLRDTIQSLGKKPSMDAAEKRKTYRLSCSLPVVVHVNQREALAGRLTNLSTTGLKIRFSKILKVGQVYTLRIRGKVVPGGNPSRELTVQANCVWCRRDPHGEGYDIGCTFAGFVGVNMEQVLDFFRVELGIDVTEASQKRHTTRIAKRFPITYTGPDGKVQNAFVRNLSMTGMQIASRTPVEVGLHLNVTVDLGGKADKLHTVVLVVRCRRIPREEWYEIGVELQGLPDKEQQKLESLVAAYMKEAWAEG